MFKYVELFHSIQCEGRNSGVNSVFLRLHGCNLNCDFCDTKYAKDEECNNLISNEEIIEYLLQTKCNQLVITGGEPMLQCGDIECLYEKLPENINLEIETNGTINPYRFSFIHNHINNIKFSVSPKLSFSGNNFKTNYKLSILEGYKELDSIFKFVVDPEKEDECMKEINDMVTSLSLNKNRIFLMPLGKTKEEQEQNALPVIEIAKKYGYNVSPRLHIMLWGTKRGV